MKKFVTLLIFTVLTGVATAQTTQFGIRTRYTSAKQVYTQSGMSTTSGAVDNVDIGVFVQRDYGQVSFQPGLALILKGGFGGTTFRSTGTTFTSSITTLEFTTLELPLNVVYNIKLKPGRIFLGGGPYIGYNLSGTAQFNTTTSNISGNFTLNEQYSQKVAFTSDANDFKRFEVGLNALAGFRLNNGIELNLGIGAGLTSITNDTYNNITNRTLSAGLGYWFH